LVGDQVRDHESRHDPDYQELIDRLRLDEEAEDFPAEEGLWLDWPKAPEAHESDCLDEEFPTEASSPGVAASEQPAQELPSELASPPVGAGVRHRHGRALVALAALAVMAVTGALGLEAVRRSRPQDERPSATRVADVVLISEAPPRQPSAPVEVLAPALDVPAPPIAPPAKVRDERRTPTSSLPPSRVVKQPGPTVPPSLIGTPTPSPTQVVASNTSSSLVDTPPRTAADVPAALPAGTSGAPSVGGRPVVERPVDVDFVAAERAPAAAVVTPTSAIQRALAQYQTAYSQMDVAAVRRLWPTVDGKALARAFDQLRQENLTFESCDVGVNGRTALASCAGTAQYVPKVGNKSPRVERQQWRISLRQAIDAWVIDRVEVSRD
jgi:hypothetical protein